MSRTRDEDGIVLLLVLALIVVSISTAYAMSKTTLIEARAVKDLERSARTSLAARSAVALALRTIQDDQTGGSDVTRATESRLDGWALLSAQPLVLPGGTELRFNIRDAGAGVNLNSLVDSQGKVRGELPKNFLKAALAYLRDNTPALAKTSQLGDQTIDDLSDAILDWIDQDEETRLGTPEEEFWVEMHGAKSPPVNRRLFSLDELAPIKGVDGLLLQALKAYFTTQPMFPVEESGGVNPNTAPAHVLGLLYHGVGGELELIDARDVFALLKSREEGRVFCPAAGIEPCVTLFDVLGIAEGETIFPPLSYEASVFRVDVEARELDTRSCVHTVIDRGASRAGAAAATPPAAATGVAPALSTAPDSTELRVLYYELGC